MKCSEKIKNIFYYLLRIKRMNKLITNVKNYERVYTEEQISKNEDCDIKIDNKNKINIKISSNSGNIYKDIYKYYLDEKDNKNNNELIMGQAILVLKGTKDIIHPIITTKLKVDFCEKENIISLKSDYKINLETEICDFLDKDIFKEIIENKSKLEKDIVNMMLYAQIKDSLQSLMNFDKEKVIFKKQRDLNKILVTEDIVIYDCPLVIIRKKDNSIWSKEVNSMVEAIDKGYPIPKTVEALIEEKEIETDDKNTQQWKDCMDDILFPLEANEQQISIAKKICENEAILVQGPPGTGKSHTIANLICHFIANGKKVLVTSETSRALKVLSSKLPNEIRPLCVNLLNDEENDTSDLESCIKNISETLCENPKGIIDDIDILERERIKCKQKQEVLYNKLREIEFIENKKVHCDGQYYKLIHIGKWLKENENDSSWIKDDIRYKDIQPVNEKQFNEILNLLRKNDKEYIDNTNDLIFLCEKLPQYNEISNKIDRIIYLKGNLNFYKDKLKGWYIPADSKCNYNVLIDFLYKCIDNMKELKEQYIFGEAFKLYYSSEIFRDSINNFLLNLNNSMEKLQKIKANIDKYSINIKDVKDINLFIKDYEKIYCKISGKKKIGKMFKIFNNKYEYIFKNCYIDGENINTIEQLHLMKDYIEEKKIYNFLNTLWKNIITEYIDEEFEYNMDNLLYLENVTRNLEIITDWNREYRDKIIDLLGKIRIPINIHWYDIDTYEDLIQCIESIKHIDEYNDLKAFMEITKKQVRNFDKLNNIIEGIDKENIDYIKDAYNYIEDIIAMKPYMGNINYIYIKLKDNCPKTLDFILNNYDKDYIFNNWEKAWKWAQYNNLFKRIDKIDERKIQIELIEERDKEKKIINEIVVKKAWQNIILSIGEEKKRSLFSWVQAVKRIGKGRGKFALQYIKIAQEEMEKCKSIIPVWIMPLEKVIENIKPSKEQFDVVIFDESSQSNVFAISALMRAKKAIIVGDDKQISPELVGIDQSMVNNLIDKYLYDIPHNQWFDLQTSLYDTSLRIFKNRIMLKEHFRSVPEIVQFSNKLCYSDLVVPLRYPRINEAFNPPIRAIKVKDGLKEKSKQINIKEAEDLVGKILKCCRDIKYNGMTMGVISLLGDAQSEFIESLLRSNLSKEEIKGRKLICGDAYSFQGQERDIMFLSMVVGDNVKYTALTKESDIRRFNVAVSRARNQVFLFYSIDEKNLNNNCVRYKLIDYFINYKDYKSKLPNVNYVIQSRFQKDVYNRIKNLNCDIKFGVKIGKYIIDFVLEGAHNRVAIICDEGNLYDYNKLQNILNLEMDLGRLGWHFYKVRGSKFYRSPEKEIEKIYMFLKEMGLDKNNPKQIVKDNLRVV